MTQNSRNSYNDIFTFNKIYLHPRYYFTSSNCIFMQLQGIVFIQLQGIIYLLTVKEINSSKEHIFIHKRYNHSRQFYSFTELYSFQGTYQPGLSVHSMKSYSFKEISPFKENIFIQGNYIHLRNIFIYGTYIRSSSGLYVHLRKR